MVFVRNCAIESVRLRHIHVVRGNLCWVLSQPRFHWAYRRYAVELPPDVDSCSNGNEQDERKPEQPELRPSPV
jgi:hypothetical protein